MKKLLLIPVLLFGCAGTPEITDFTLEIEQLRGEIDIIHDRFDVRESQWVMDLNENTASYWDLKEAHKHDHYKVRQEIAIVDDTLNRRIDDLEARLNELEVH
jgi:hypothetical protein